MARAEPQRSLFDAGETKSKTSKTYVLLVE